jgi:hypothetical protein
VSGLSKLSNAKKTYSFKIAKGGWEGILLRSKCPPRQACLLLVLGHRDEKEKREQRTDK